MTIEEKQQHVGPLPSSTSTTSSHHELPEFRARHGGGHRHPPIGFVVLDYGRKIATALPEAIKSKQGGASRLSRPVSFMMFQVKPDRRAPSGPAITERARGPAVRRHKEGT